MRRVTTAAAVALCVATTAVLALAQDDGWKAISKRYDELSRNHDDDANRERRYVLLDMFPFRTEKACRKILREAFDDEKTIDNRVAVVHLLAGCGDPKQLDFLMSEFKKEKALAPVIALGEGLGFTPEENRADLTARALKHLRKAKDDIRLSLIEGLGELRDPSAVEWLRDQDKLTPKEYFERNVALGRCGGADAVALLAPELENALSDARLGAARGLAAIDTDEAWELVKKLVADPDERIVRFAAGALATAGRKDAAPAIADALGNAVALRSREDLRAALRSLLSRDMGHDAEAWKALAAGSSATAPAELPTIATVFGMPVASDRFALLIDTSRSTGWMDRLKRMRDECVAFVESVPTSTSFALGAAAWDFRPYSDGLVNAGNRADAIEWISELQPGGGCDMREALTTTMERDTLIDTIVIVTDSHPWGSARNETSRETMEVFRRMNRTRGVRLVIALVMPGGRYESSERSPGEIDERIDYLTEMAEDSGGTFVNVEE